MADVSVLKDVALFHYLWYSIIYGILFTQNKNCVCVYEFLFINDNAWHCILSSYCFIFCKWRTLQPFMYKFVEAVYTVYTILMQLKCNGIQAYINLFYFISIFSWNGKHYFKTHTDNCKFWIKAQVKVSNLKNTDMVDWVRNSWFVIHASINKLVDSDQTL